jgi:hypothetical protein
MLLVTLLLLVLLPTGRSWKQHLDPAFNQMTDPKVPNMRVLFVGGAARRVIHAIARLNSTYFIQGNTTNGVCNSIPSRPRVEPLTLLSIRSSMLLVLPRLGQRWRLVLIFRLSRLAYLQGRKTENQEFNVNGNVVDNGIDAVGGTLTTEPTCTVKNPAANVILFNFTGCCRLSS